LIKHSINKIIPPAFRSYIYDPSVLYRLHHLGFLLTENLVPLATLVSATQPPAKKQDVILSPDGFKRYFVTHGGLFSKDGITLDEIRAIKRIGRQPGTEGLMCTLSFIFTAPGDSTHLH
jgi:hypothetical protein